MGLPRGWIVGLTRSDAGGGSDRDYFGSAPFLNSSLHINIVKAKSVMRKHSLCHTERWFVRTILKFAQMCLTGPDVLGRFFLCFFFVNPRPTDQFLEGEPPGIALLFGEVSDAVDFYFHPMLRMLPRGPPPIASALTPSIYCSSLV